MVGKGYNGTSWINHAWNEVYIDESDSWIEVDTTFGETGNYFKTTLLFLFFSFIE